MHRQWCSNSTYDAMICDVNDIRTDDRGGALLCGHIRVKSGVGGGEKMPISAAVGTVVSRVTLFFMTV